MTDYSIVEKDSNTPAGGAEKGYKVGSSDFGTISTEIESSNNSFVEILEVPFLVFFTWEMFTKIIALGFTGSKHTYIKDPWNKLDILVVFVGWLSLILDAVDPNLLPINLGVLRAFRILRPLRSISRLPGLRRVIQSLISSIPYLIDLVILVGFCLLIFSILGMQLFSGKMHYRCRLTEFPVRLDPTCNSTSTDNYLGLDCWKTYLDNVLADPDVYRCSNITILDKDIDDKSSSPWSTAQDCIWPMDTDYPGGDNGGLCSEESNLQKNTCGAAFTCGSNYDPYGNGRFIRSDTPYGYDRMISGTWSEDFNYGVTQFDNIGQR